MGRHPPTLERRYERAVMVPRATPSGGFNRARPGGSARTEWRVPV